MGKVMMAMLVALSVAGAAGSAAAKPALRDVEAIDEGLYTVGLADQIRKRCPTIQPRIFRALAFLRDLESQARALGYTEAEVEAHLDSDAEKDRLRARAAEYMASQGFGQDETGYCALGRAEIARKSAIGALLRATD